MQCGLRPGLTGKAQPASPGPTLPWTLVAHQPYSGPLSPGWPLGRGPRQCQAPPLSQACLLSLGRSGSQAVPTRAPGQVLLQEGGGMRRLGGPGPQPRIGCGTDGKPVPRAQRLSPPSERRGHLAQGAEMPARRSRGPGGAPGGVSGTAPQPRGSAALRGEPGGGDSGSPAPEDHPACYPSCGCTHFAWGGPGCGVLPSPVECCPPHQQRGGDGEGTRPDRGDEVQQIVWGDGGRGAREVTQHLHKDSSGGWASVATCGSGPEPAHGPPPAAPPTWSCGAGCSTGTAPPGLQQS